MWKLFFFFTCKNFTIFVSATLKGRVTNAGGPMGCPWATLQILKSGVFSWLVILTLLVRPFWLMEREESRRKHTDPGSPGQTVNHSLTRPDSAAVAQPLTQFSELPPPKPAPSVLLSDPHPSILSSSPFSFSASFLNWRLHFLVHSWPQCPRIVILTQPGPVPGSPASAEPQTASCSAGKRRLGLCPQHWDIFTKGC